MKNGVDTIYVVSDYKKFPIYIYIKTSSCCNPCFELILSSGSSDPAQISKIFLSSEPRVYAGASVWLIYIVDTGLSFTLGTINDSLLTQNNTGDSVKNILTWR